MDLLERTVLVGVGIGIGFVLGYITSQLRKIEEEVTEVLDIEHHRKGEQGALRRPTVQQFALFIVVALSFWAAFQSGQASNDAENTIICVVEYNTAQGQALEGRDGAAKDATQSEIDLWTSYEKLYKIATEDPSKTEQVQEQLNNDIIKHRDELIEIQKTREANPYPDPELVKTCKEQ
jgi:PDZ domain-containing secreted protein